MTGLAFESFSLVRSAGRARRARARDLFVCQTNHTRD